MEKAKAAISDFISKDGKHKTTVDQDHAKAITEEHVRPHQHENLTTAVDREVHKDHHYTTVQPVTAKEVLPEQHHHNLVPVEHKSIDHGGQNEMAKTLQRDAAQYQDTTTTHKTTESHSTAPTVTGEHVHHHVHEHVQPVIQKETVQPHVVHTTVPIHETHQVAPVHHGTKVAPTKTLEEFRAGGGILQGKATKALHEYDGCPQTENTTEGHHHKHAAGVSGSTTKSENVDRLADTLGTKNTEQTASVTGTESSMFGKDKDRTNIRQTKLGEENYRTSQLDDQRATAGTTAVPRSENTSTATDKQAAGTGPWRAGETHQLGEQPARKVSLVDKVNPFKDADGDGKKGFMK